MCDDETYFEILKYQSKKKKKEKSAHTHITYLWLDEMRWDERNNQKRGEYKWVKISKRENRRESKRIKPAKLEKNIFIII